MIKNAKAGDILYTLKYNYRTETYKIKKFTVIEDLDSITGYYYPIWSKNHEHYFALEVFKTLKAAKNKYRKILKLRINHFQKKIKTINKYLEAL